MMGLAALADNRGGNHSSYLNEQQMQELKRIITTSYPVYAKGWIVDIITDLIEYHFNVKYANGSIYPLLKRLGLTHKIATKIDSKKSEAKITTWKEDIKKLIELSPNVVLLSQDESRFSSESNHITSWSTKGTSVSYSGYRYGTSLNCFGIFNLSNGHLISSFHDTGNTLTTIEHFKIVREYYGDKPIVYLIDNASWHKTKKVREYCEENNITLLFLSPYSPEYNPIERV